MQAVKNLLKKLYNFTKGTTFFVIAVLTILTVRWTGVDHFVVPSGSMIPTFLVLDHIVVKKYAYGLRIPFTKKWVSSIKVPDRGDVVVFRSVTGDYFMVKRVIGKEGDIVRISNNQVLVNGQVLKMDPLTFEPSDDFYPISNQDLQDDMKKYNIYLESLHDKQYRILWKQKGMHQDYEWEVPEGHLFVIGDNRDNSQDSRYWGFLPLNHLMGEAVGIWLSCDKSLFQLPLLCYPWTFRVKRMFRSLDQKQIQDFAR